MLQFCLFVNSPIIFDFDKYGSYSGPTMRYLYVCAHIKALFDIDKILPIQEKVYSHLKEFIMDDSSGLPFSKKLALPLKNNIP